MALIDEVKVACRTTTSDPGLIQELNDLIDAAKADMILSGIIESKIKEDDSLIKRAIILYVKAEFGLDNSESEKYNNSYLALKEHLCLSGEYTEEVV